MGQGLQLSVLVAHCARSVLEVEGKRITLFPRTVDTLAHAARLGGPRFELIVADWPAVPQLAPLAEWLPGVVGDAFPFQVLAMAGPFDKGKALNSAARAAAAPFLFCLDADMLVPPELLAQGVDYCAAGRVWFPGFSGKGGDCPRSTGNLFIRRDLFLELGGVRSQTKWGGEDWEFAQRVIARGLAAEDVTARRPFPGFHHLAHPRFAGWNREPRSA